MLLLGRTPFWSCWPIHWFFAWLLLLLATAAMAFSFLFSQFRARNSASAFFLACNNVMTQWLIAPITEEAHRTEELFALDNMLVFAPVKTEFQSLRRPDASLSQWLALVLVVLWSVVAGAYVRLTYVGYK